MSLKEYNDKRNFSSTNEPKGKKKKSSANRFVIQYHRARKDHYDFRLEYKGVLLSWAVPKGLSQNPKDKRLGVKVEDHPIDYINFEGIIPEGNYGAGTVEIYDSGNYLPIEDMEKGLKKRHLKIVLNGEKLKGGWSLINTKEDNWIIVKLTDDYIEENKVKKIEKLPFKQASIQLATLTQKIPKGKDWVFEIKYDGYRMLCYKDKTSVKLLSRNNIEYTKRFEDIVKSIQLLGNENFVLDGEIVVFDDKGRSDFGKLQRSIKSGNGNFVYVVFDLLALDGEDLRQLPLSLRKSKLERMLYKCKNNIMFSSHVEQGEKCFKFAKEYNLEGIIAKKIASKYLGKRTEDWLKIKCYLRQEFVVIGYTTTDKNNLLSAILLGYYEGKELKFVGKCGSGFSEEDKKELSAMFNIVTRKTCPCKEKIYEKNVVWLKPKIIAEIQYVELTKDSSLRQPSFLGLRKDKEAKDIILERKK